MAPAERLPAERLLRPTTVVLPRDRKLLETPTGPRLCVVVPTSSGQRQTQEQADEGAARGALLKPERYVVCCCVMTKAHMLITSIS